MRRLSITFAAAVGLLALAAVTAVRAGPDRIIVPPPTPAELAAPPGPRTQAIDVREAKIDMGWIPVLAIRPLGGMAEQKIAIIDTGFKGLPQWLEAHPQEKSRTTYVGDLAAIGPTTPSHGFDVFRVARAVIADAHLFLYKATNLKDVVSAIEDAANKGVIIINASFEFTDLDVAEGDKSLGDLFDFELRRREIFIFFAAGNERQRTHTWRSSANMPRLSVRLPAAKVYVNLNWDFRSAPDADYQVELWSSNGRLLASAGAEKHKGTATVFYQAGQPTDAEIRIKRLAGPASGVVMRLQAGRGIVPRGGFNGLQSEPIYAYRENPFMIFVGAMGRTASGKLAPSYFSDLGRLPDGALLPHVLGPGQLKLGNETLDGTSFAAPFITAVYGAIFGFNYKNLMERTATKAQIDPSVPEFARSRYGVPSVMEKLFTPKGQITITGPTKVEEVSHRVEGDQLVVKFAITRCCMEGLTWYVGAFLYDVQDKKFARDAASGKPLVAAVTLHSDKKDYVKQPVEIRFPLKALEAYKGKPLKLRFDIEVRSWRAAAASYAKGKIRVDEAPDYEITL